jgi:Tfp pilus assembly protein PilX
MRPATKSLSKALRRAPRNRQQGIALITTLLLVLLLTGMALTMVLSVSSDMLLNGYYGNYRGSFYAADSGLNIARQNIVNSLNGQIGTTFNPNVAPIANMSSASSTAASAGSAGFGTFTAVNTAQSWPEKVEISNVSVGTGALCTVQGGLTGATCASPTQNALNPILSYTYTFPYSVKAVGEAQGSEAATLTDAGVITLVANTGLGTVTTSFSAWGMFIDQYPECGSALVPGTITGPVFTNGAWNFNNTGTYNFTDTVSSVATTSGYEGSSCNQSATVPNGFNVNFAHGINLGAPPASLPQNSFNQEQAVVDGIGNSTTPPSNATLHAALKDASGAAYPSTGASTGVFVPYSTNTSGVKTFNGGGILVQGDAKVTLAPGSTSTAQVYTIVQGGTTTTITTDPSAGSAGTTTISSPLGTQVITGVPQQFTTTGQFQGDGTMLYVNGNITALTGPGQGQAAVNNGTALTITAASDVTITGDILYKTEPVTLTATSGPPAVPIDTLVPANNTGQVLGIFTASGNVNLANTQSNGNLEIDASVATISQGGSGGIVNTGNSINTLTIVGGRIQNTIQNIGATTRNVLFDQRFAGGAFAPPWFPSTNAKPAGSSGESVIKTVRRTQWFNQTTYQ